MTEVAFHFGAPDRLAYTCRLLRKATVTGVRLQVRSSPDLCGELDIALWNLGPTEFISHCNAMATQALRSRSAVLLVDEAAELDADFSILVNLADDVPDGFERFERVIEIVGTDEQERSLARQRWKHYTARGYTITRHDLKLRGAESP